MLQGKLKAQVHGPAVKFSLIAFILYIAFICGCAGLAERLCVEERTAFDIGSSTLKMKTASVDKCRPAPIRIIRHKEVKVPFAGGTRNRILGRDIQDQGLAQVQVMKMEAQAAGAEKFAGAATAAFREADNASQFLAEIEARTGIRIRLISQEEEAVLGYQAAIARLPGAVGNIVVWDIGGKSMQITMKSKDGNYRIYRGDLAAVSFKNQIIESIHRRSAGEAASPNPIGRPNLAAALEMARSAATGVPNEIRSYLHRTGTTVVGIGGVHNQSIRKQLGETSAYRRENLEDAVRERIDWTDAQIGGAYADTDISNLILVLGFMKELDIAEVRLADANLADGILIDPTFW